MVTDPEPMSSLVEEFADQLEHAQERWPVVRTGEREPIDDSLRLMIKMRDGFACVWCYRSHELVLDHIIPWSAGGSDDPTNLRTLCWDCNETRSNRRYAGDLRPRLPLARSCTRCRPPAEDEWNDLTAAFCIQCRRRGRVLPGEVQRAEAAQPDPGATSDDPAPAGAT